MNGGPNMLYQDFITKLIGLQGLQVKNFEKSEKGILIYAELVRKEHHCPCCGEITDKIHDYREQSIKDIPAFRLNVTIVLRKRRYRCPH